METAYLIKPNPIGRPSEYDPKYCDMLIRHCEQGLTIETFAASIDRHRSVVNRWANANEDFREAMDIAKDKHRLFYERIVANSALCGDELGRSKSATWMLEKTQRKDFGRDPSVNLHTHNHAGEQTMNIVDIKVLSLETKKALARDLMDRKELVDAED
jgi:hypothetical protein